MKFEQGDELLGKLSGEMSVKPARPDETVYSDVNIELLGDDDLIYCLFGEGSVIGIKIVYTGNSLKAKLNRDIVQHSDGLEESHKSWIQTLKHREGEVDFEVKIDDLPEKFDPSETETTTKKQEEKGSSVISEQDTWSESKSDTMSDLKNL